MKLQVVELGGYLGKALQAIKKTPPHHNAKNTRAETYRNILKQDETSAQPRIVHIYLKRVVVSEETCNSGEIFFWEKQHWPSPACTVWESNAYCCIVVAPAGHTSRSDLGDPDQRIPGRIPKASAQRDTKAGQPNHLRCLGLGFECRNNTQFKQLTKDYRWTYIDYYRPYSTSLHLYCICMAASLTVATGKPGSGLPVEKQSQRHSLCCWLAARPDCLGQIGAELFLPHWVAELTPMLQHGMTCHRYGYVSKLGTPTINIIIKIYQHISLYHYIYQNLSDTIEIRFRASPFSDTKVSLR